ncbi:pep-cterm sorting domain-containing protein [Anaeramoeba ignava]|uniref:Pep-cterm sorting domain-containing protein n=1 Tax=Anaeramoeba ignava TaxID=1746090 RepID=A0A9Q0R925_ANAIG|nr:pep-cterm sorting domain-containing protein [Anaeramoeba ignava]
MQFKFYFSSKYLIDELIEISSNFIKNNLQIETIVDILKLSESMNLNQLLDSSYKFICGNFKEFIKTSHFFELEENHLNSILSNDKISINEFELFQSIIKWGKHKSNINQEKEIDKEKLQDQISNVIPKIRFIDFSKQELKDTLKEDLIPNQISQKLTQFQKLQKEEKELKQFIEKEDSLIFKSRIKFESEIIQEREHSNKLKEWINDDDFFSKMKKGFSAKKDGFSGRKLHTKIMKKGKVLIIIKTKDNFIFGGFTSVGWKKGNDDKYIKDSKAFIFSLRNDKNDRKPEKFPIKKDEKEEAIFYCSEDESIIFGDGPDFDLDSDLKGGSSNFGKTYKLPKGLKFRTKEAKSYLAGSYNKWIVDEIECFFI